MPPLYKVMPLRGDEGANFVRQMAARSRGATDATLNQIGALMLSDMQGFTNTWEHRPAFKMVRTKNTVSVVTDSRIFGWVDKGTRPHEIRAKAGGVLAFRSNFQPKSRAGNAAFKGRGTSSGPTVFAQVVHHPGTAPRNYTKLEQQKISKVGRQIFKQQLKQFVGQRNP